MMQLYLIILNLIFSIIWFNGTLKQYKISKATCEEISRLPVLIIQPHSFRVLNRSFQLILKVFSLHLAFSLKLQCPRWRNYDKASIYVLYFVTLQIVLSSLLYHLSYCWQFYVFFIFFLDGLPTNEAIILRKIDKFIARIRVFLTVLQHQVSFLQVG